LTQRQVAAGVEVSLRTYQKWEKGEIPKEEWLIRLARFLDLTEAESNEFYRASAHTPPEIGNLPFPRNPFFTGRETYLEQLEKHFKENNNVPIALSGLGGIGKTQLALEYAHRNYRKEYRAVLWVNAANKAALEASYISLAHLLDLPKKDTGKIALIIQEVKTWLNEHTSWLLILDNVDDVQLASAFLPTQHRGNILLTMRTQVTGTLRRIDVAPLPQNHGSTFLLHRASLLASNAPIGQTTTPDAAMARAICKELGGLPLALDQAGAYIDETGCSVADYLKKYRTHRAVLLRRRGGSVLDHPESGDSEAEYSQPVATTWSLSFEKVEQRNPGAAELLRMCAFLAPDAIPEELFQQEYSLALDAISFDEAVAALRRYSLVERNRQEKMLSVHRLVQAVIFDAMSDSTRSQWRERVVRAMNEAFSAALLKEWVSCERLLPHVLVCATWIEEHKPIAVQQEASSLLDKAGSYLREQGWYADAELLLKQALSIREQHMGAEHLDTATSLSSLAGLYAYQNRFPSAEHLVERALAIRKQHWGADHPETAKSMNNLATLYMQRKQYEQAEPLFLQALSINENHLGVEHLDTMKYRGNLGVMYLEQEQYEKAKPLFEGVLTFYKHHLGTKNPETARVMGNRALVYMQQGEYKKAESLFQQALSIHEKCSGKESPDTAYPLYGLAELYRRQGKYEQSEQFYQRTLSIRKQYLDLEHLDTAESLQGLAELYRELGRNEESQSLYQEALRIWEQQLGSEHQLTKRTRESYEALLQLMECDTEAQELEAGQNRVEE